MKPSMAGNKLVPATKMRTLTATVGAFVFLICSCFNSVAHPLGNFTINHFSRIDVGRTQVRLRYVIDMAEIPAFQELQALAGPKEGSPAKQALESYAQRVGAGYAERLLLTIDSSRVPLELVSKNIELVPGAGGMATMRLECDFTTEIPLDFRRNHRLQFEDNNYPERIGWKEIVVTSSSGLSIYNSSAYGNAITDELKNYPGDLAAPPDERSAEFSLTAGVIPSGSRPLQMRDGTTLPVPARDRLAELIAVPNVTPGVALFGLVIAVLLGGLHAMSPGHGKAVVGAYLVGSRGTPRHAAFLGLTVTVTHTAGVFALGLATLLASQYVVPERLYPVLSMLSGAIVVLIGVSLFIRRCRSVMAHQSHVAWQEHASQAFSSEHCHGGYSHSHLPPGKDGSPVTWKSLLLLGISGGLLPCPSALVVLLAAISLHRVGYGLLLVVAFSIGLAGMLTGVGLIFVYARRLVHSSDKLGRFGQLERLLPVVSALVITCAGVAICAEALRQGGIDFSGLFRTFRFDGSASLASAGALGLLGLGLLYGLKHATEADHIVAVATIVSAHRKLTRAAIVGGLWGVGHTASIVVVGALVLVLKIAIPAGVASWLEFGVALMIIGLGAAAVRRASHSRSDLHVHKHAHGDLVHAHIHFHDVRTPHATPATLHSHEIERVGLKPLMVGAMHGLAGSAALTLLVLTQIKSAMLGLVYLAVFGGGSMVGMLIMSGLVGVPFVMSARKLNGVHYRLQLLAGALSVAFGIWYAFETGLAGGLISAVATI
jgi:ABC-type nickel/cobalt efflux system permease component RcnA